MTYTDLQADIAGWMNRTDLTAQIPGFIRIAESRMQLDVRSWQMIAPVSVFVQAAGAASIPVPDDWLEWDALYIDRGRLEYVTPDVMQQFIREGSTANIQKYSMVGNQLYVGGPPRADEAPVSVHATYYAKIPALADAALSNWLLDTYPALYLYASLVSACTYVGDDQGSAGYSALYAALLTDINSNATKATVSGGTWRKRSGMYGGLR